LSRFFVVFYNRIIITSLIKILALSRLNNLVWFLVSILTGIQFFFIYYWLFLGIYFIFLSPVKSISAQMLSSSHLNKIIKVFFLLSLGGLPPFLGFLGKLIIIKSSLFVIGPIFLFLLVIRSLIILFIYIRFSFIVLTFPIISRLIEVENNNTLVKVVYFLSIFIWPLILL